MIELGDLLTAVPEAQVLRRGPESFTQAAVDTRSLQGGELFVAITGHARDGHDFVTQAVAAGATGLIIVRPDAAESLPADADVTVVLVPDTLDALQRTGAQVRLRSGAAVVAITGSVGKTTTKSLVTAALTARFSTLSNKASFNNHLGVPLTLAAIGPEHTHVVSEIGTNHRGEIAHLVSLVRPDVAVVTNVGTAHLGNFSGRDELALEKTDLLRHVRPGGTWIVNGDDALLRRTALSLPEAASARVVTVGFEADNDIRAVDVTVDEAGTRGVLWIGDDKYDLALAASGRHFVFAAMIAVAVASAFGVEPAATLAALRGEEPPAGRASLRRVDERLLVIDDSYNGSPDAMRAAIDLLGQLEAATKVAVLGEMRELGSFSAELHAQVGQAVAATATHLITVGADAGPLREAAAAHGLAGERIQQADSAAHAYRLVDAIVAGEPRRQAVVLAKGSRFMHMERVHLGLAGSDVRCPLSVCTLYINCSTCPQLSREG